MAPNDPTPRSSEEGSPPPLDTGFDDPSSKERVYSALVQTREPTPVQEIAKRADCHADTARKDLDWFTQLDIATQYDGRPTIYEPNEAYFEWRYVNSLVEHHTIEELHESVQDPHNRLEKYREKCDTEDPSTVNALEVATDETIDDVWSDLTNWASLQDEFRLHERARQLLIQNPNSTAIHS